jgi:hypothetical protein
VVVVAAVVVAPWSDERSDRRADRREGVPGVAIVAVAMAAAVSPP